MNRRVLAIMAVLKIDFDLILIIQSKFPILTIKLILLEDQIIDAPIYIMKLF